jgi:uncharacterized protein YcbK (DUF882 family)
VVLLPVLLLCVAALPQRAGAGSERTLTFYEIHTKETATITYKRDGEYLPEGLKQINHIMRDWRRDVETEMDPELIDLIWELHQQLGSKEPIHLISGHRSRKTNEKLRRAGGGQAKYSQHILGKAADIHFPDVPVKTLRNSALVREVGGVGYYPKSGIPFVHVDTGRVRNWPRLPRMELAALFPDGKTKYRPRDGRPITLADARKAIKNGKYPGPPTLLAINETPAEKPARKSTVMMASADQPSAKAPIAAAADKPAAKAPVAPAAAQPATKAPVVMAKLDAHSLTEFMRKMGITGSIATPALASTTDQGPAMRHLASASPSAGMPAIPAHAASAPLPDQATAEDDPDYDPEHPELAYRPFPVLPLMGDRPLSHGGKTAALVAPDFTNDDYLLAQPDLRVSMAMTAKSGFRQFASGLEPGASTGRHRPDATPAPKAPQSRPGRVMTASSPASASSGLATGGYGGGSTMSLGFQ